MRKTLLDISKKIDPETLKVLKVIKDLADSLQIDFFLVGATVRDMLLYYVYDIKNYRKTNDIDFAVKVKNWDEYSMLTEAVEKRGFRKDKRMDHRFHTDALVINFIPFGEIADKNNKITWQDNEYKEMNVIGFDDAFFNSEDIIIQTEPYVIIKTASVESLVMLKLFAWNDRTAEVRIKDAQDLYLMISTYLRAGNEERLFEDHSDIVGEAADYELTGARLLGRDIAKVASEVVKSKILEILKDDNFKLLANEMAQYEGLSSERDKKAGECRELLSNVCLGLEDK